MTTQSLTIGGMSCGHCVMAVRRALESVEGVTVDEVRIGQATVQFDESAVQADVVAEAVRDAGYDVLAAS
jgi:copper chaperone